MARSHDHEHETSHDDPSLDAAVAAGMTGMTGVSPAMAAGVVPPASMLAGGLLAGR